MKTYHYFVTQDIASASSFTKTINVPFHCERVIVQSVSYYNDLSENGLSLLRTDLISTADNVLCAFGEQLGHQEGSFELNKPVQGTYTFEVLTLAKVLSTARAGDLVIHLEFQGQNV